MLQKETWDEQSYFASSSTMLALLNPVGHGAVIGFVGACISPVIVYGKALGRCSQSPTPS
jgi:hypothetical protein